MEDKTQYEALMEELKKLANNFRDVVTELGDILAKLLPDVEIPEEEEDTWEMKCPYKDGDEYYLLKSFGDFQKMEWTNHLFDELALMQGNIFTTEEAVVLEVKRRNLLTRFRAFRNECNGDWKPDWNDIDQKKYIIRCEETDLYYVVAYCTLNGFNLFGYFKNEQDAERAIELFGDEIKELFVEKRLANENN